MNAVGVLGNFLINNQLAIEIFLLIVLAGILVYWIIKQAVIKPKQDAAIEELISKIDSLESKLSGVVVDDIKESVAQAEVGDSAEAEAAEKPVPEAKDEATPEAAEEAAKEAIEESNLNTEATETSEQPETKAAPARKGIVRDDDDKAVIMKRLLAEEEEIEDGPNPNLEETMDIIDIVMEEKADSAFAKPQSKYASRSWGEDKHGNYYTEELLKKQIG